MTLWRLEWLRLLRTKRWVVVFGVFLFFGLVGPLTARYLAEILDMAGGELSGSVIELPPPIPADGMVQFASNAMQLGTLVVVVVAAGALAFDSIPEMGVFLRSRVRGVERILAPRFVITSSAVVLAFAVGAGAAWYETWVLIGAPDLGSVVIGVLLGSLFLVFAVALVAAVAGMAGSVLSTVIVSVVILLLMPIVGAVRAVGVWLPSHLAGAISALATGETEATDYLGVAVVTIVATCLLLWVAVVVARRREL